MMWFYIIALIPVIIGYVIWLLNKHVNWIEWVGCSAAGFLLAGIMHAVSIYGMTADTETWSGQIASGRQFSAWQEYYEEAIYRTEYYTETEYYTTTDSKGRSHRHSRQVTKSRRVFDHWESRNRWHTEYFKWYSNIQTDYDVSKERFAYICGKFKDNHAVPGDRTTSEHNSKMIGGDPNDYVANNKTGWIEPVTKLVSFENRVKAAPSVFSFINVPTNINVYAYPANSNPFVSDRLLGKAKKDFNQLQFDQLNARLGPKKRVNLIIIGFDTPDTMIGEYQRAKYIGGKKNDLVIMYGLQNSEAGTPTTAWCKVFGWTEKDVVKANLQSLFLEHPINNDLLPLIEEEIIKNYVIKDWHKFDYLSVEPTTSYYIWFIIILIITQSGLWIWCSFNEFDKEDLSGPSASYKGLGSVDNNDWTCIQGRVSAPKKHKTRSTGPR